MLPSPFISANRPVYYFVVSLALCIPLAASLYFSNAQLHKLHLSDYRSYQCTTGNTDAHRTFRVLTLFFSYASEFADSLCANKTIRQHFTDVEILWRPRSYLNAQHILDEEFDLFWNRRHIVTGLVPELSNFYSLLLETPTYELYWMSKEALPTLNADYLKDKVIGLSRDSQSQTHFLQPMSALRASGISLSAKQKKFYTDPNAIYKAFNNNEVDIISTPLPLAKANDGSEVFVSLIESEVPSGAWYVSKDLLLAESSSDLECALLKSLIIYAPIFDSTQAPLAVKPACL